MANYISRYLKQAGLSTSYDDMTESQIEEKNKANPLSGYGFMSSKEKDDRQLKREMYQQELERQDKMMQEQLVARMSSQGQIGYRGMQGLLGLVDHLRGQRKSAPQPNQDDPEVARYNQMASNPEIGGPLQAKLMLGQQLLKQGNPAGAQMIADAREEHMKQQKSQLELKDLQHKTNDPNRDYEHKPGYSREIYVDLEGKPGVYTETLLKNTPDGGIWHKSKPAMKGSVTGAADTFGKSKTDKSKTVQDFEGKMTATANALDSMEKAQKLVEENPNINGWNGRLIAKVDDIYEGLKGLAGTAGIAPENYTDITKYDFGKLEKTAQGSEKLKALVLELAAARAGAAESGGRFTEGDIQRQIDQIGGSVSNPRTFMALMEQAKGTMVDNLQNQGRFMTVDEKPVGANYASQLQELQKRSGRNEPASGDNADMEAKRKKLEELRERQRQRQLNGTATQP